MSALKRPETRGSWGRSSCAGWSSSPESGSHCDFVEQRTIHTDDGRLRPDMLVRLPGDRVIVVDSKVPLDACISPRSRPARRIHSSASWTSRAMLARRAITLTGSL